ncbi:gp53-like domain-containing protein [Pseudomonas mosselii]|uniref:Putative tail fiber protein gp53-like C-terminal domain-containing protein n=1 Tax=Pseudomonas mosselii TaxID=78327 RepID=A0A7W2JV36_9PSED|nr:hypothetical protein [Pseudomonas mosselii]MBA6065717.1 hypothetical protein [Pseudomonas mosselii]
MDYPKSTPGAGLVDGRFVDENTTTGQPGSLIPASWGNGVTEELVNVIKAAGLEPDEAAHDQLLRSIRSMLSGDFKRAVRVATTAAIGLDGLQVIDGVQLAAGDRVLVKDQPSKALNGIWLAQANAWRRADDFSGGGDVGGGLVVAVAAGTTYGPSVWQLVTPGPITVGVTELTFTLAFGRVVAAGSYAKVTVDSAGRVVGGSSDLGGVTGVPAVVAGSMADIADTRFLAAADATTDKPVGINYAGGMSIKYPGGKMAIQFLGAVTHDHFCVRRVEANGIGQWRTLFHSGNFDPYSKADVADVYNRVDTNYLITQAVEALLPRRNFGSPDFIRIPDRTGGLLLVMGTTLVAPESSVDVTLPITFNMGRGALATVAAGTANNQGNYSAYATLASNSTLRLTQDVSTTTGAANQYISWMAWGY